VSDLGDLDVVVIGAGVIGLAVARELQLRSRQVVVLEAETAIGTHTSSRNSEVIHAGIYYEPGSLKATLCVEGKAELYRYCEQHGVPYKRLGKIIVATREEEVPALERILARAHSSGVSDLAWLDASDIARLEPEVQAVRGLFSPSTGIVDSHALMNSLRRDAQAQGAILALASPLRGGALRSGGGFELNVGGSQPARLRCQAIVNTAGLHAHGVAESLKGLPEVAVKRQYFAKGHYFALTGKSPFRHLVYPVPVAGGLGVHVTLDLAGQARFGPDVSWVDAVDYAFDEARAPSFREAITRYYPALEATRLVPGYTGIRPKLGPQGSPNADFLLQGAAEHGVPGLVNLYGIESPGLTASLAIARAVAGMLQAS
jgi:L-2-hydroxyglutarate oxidase LhgO